MRVRFPDQKITRPSLEHLLQNTGETPFSETVVAFELFAKICKDALPWRLTYLPPNPDNRREADPGPLAQHLKFEISNPKFQMPSVRGLAQPKVSASPGPTLESGWASALRVRLLFLISHGCG